MTQQHVQPQEKAILSFVILMMITMVSLGAFSSTIASMIIYLMLPNIIAGAFDRGKDKCLFISVSLFNISGILLLMAKPLIEEGALSSLALITMPGTIKSIYLISFTGLVFYLLVPEILSALSHQILRAQKLRYKAQIKLLTKAWDITSD